ncbi:MAG: GNAT family N-acetyltransferase [Thermaerobacter sp.]|nr:GNAT family N-acetyltransferase [Thermaerobacter sp.]
MKPSSRYPWAIREATEADAPAMIAYMRHLTAESGIYIPWTPGEFTLTVADEETVIARHRARLNAVILLAFSPDDHLIGLWNALGSERQALRHAIEFGMSVAQEHRGHGVGGALLEAGLAWAASTELVSRVELQVYRENAAAIHLYQKHGFEHEGCRRRAFYQNGRYYDALLMARLL